MPLYQGPCTILLKGRASGKVWHFGPYLAEELKSLSVLAFLLRQGLGVAHACGGKGTCKTCRTNFHGLSDQSSFPTGLKTADFENYQSHLSCAVSPWDLLQESLKSFGPVKGPIYLYLSLDYL